MIYKKVKRIDEKISAIGIGCWNFGGDWDTSNDDNAIAIVHAAIDSGVNLFDVAPVYGWHHAERVLGKALKGGLREKVVIASKCGLVWNEKHETVNDLSRKNILREIDESLERLQTDYIDIYQFHNPEFCPKPGDGSGLYECMLEAKAQGKIRHIGITNHRLSVAHEAIDSGLYETLQFPFSYLSGEKELELVKKCEAADMGFIAMKALSGGLLNNSEACSAWFSKFPNVVPIWGIQRESELDEFLSYVKNPPALTEELQALIEKDKKELQGEFCRGCGYCMPCPAGIEINNCARMIQLIRRSPSAAHLTPEAQKKMLQIENCLHCGQCKSRCPYGLDTPALLQKNLQDYKEILAGKPI